MLALVLRAVRRGGGASCANTHRLHFRVLSGRLRWAPENLSADVRRLHTEHVRVGGVRGAGKYRTGIKKFLDWYKNYYKL